MLPAVESKLSAVVFTVPASAFVRSLADVRLTLVNGVVAFPIVPTLKPPVDAVSSTVPLVLLPSIVPVANVPAFVATKLKSVPADDAPIVTVPIAVSDIFALPLALAVMFATDVVNAVPGVVP